MINPSKGPFGTGEGGERVVGCTVAALTPILGVMVQVHRATAQDEAPRTAAAYLCRRFVLLMLSLVLSHSLTDTHPLFFPHRRWRASR